jgi:hypothetical protein
LPSAQAIDLLLGCLDQAGIPVDMPRQAVGRGDIQQGAVQPAGIELRGIRKRGTHPVGQALLHDHGIETLEVATRRDAPEHRAPADVFPQNQRDDDLVGIDIPIGGRV